jgi:hypothetical protein
MDNHQIPGHPGLGAAIGSALSICIHLLQTNWAIWATAATMELIKVVVIGLVGGAAGVVGTRLMKRYYHWKNQKKLN